MDKKDIYEHLAKIYLDASSKRKKKTKEYHKSKKLFFIGFTVIFLSIFSLATYFYSNNHFASKFEIISEIALVIQPNIVKINFNFNPAKKEIYNINLNGLDLNKFKALRFQSRKADFNDNITLKIEFTNIFNHTSDIYINTLPTYKWHDYQIPFSDFKEIRNWSEISSISFIVEDWNTKGKQGIVYIDNVRFLR